MKILLLNGSPRKGNTVALLNAFAEGAKEGNEIEVLDCDKLNISPCKGCDACNLEKGCVAKDDSTKIVDKLVDADLIVFGSPVYWWGITAQLKILIDKCYCRGRLLKDKKIGVLTVGAEVTTDEEYKLIQRQFELISDFLNWTVEFYKPYSASGKDEIANNNEVIAELNKLGSEYTNK
ncbi:MAG: flavodoxin family protein [Clostridia bacterium]|nr:flavodoxin family protein [Clostridia bacterium]